MYLLYTVMYKCYKLLSLNRYTLGLGLVIRIYAHDIYLRVLFGARSINKLSYYSYL